MFGLKLSKAKRKPNKNSVKSRRVKRKGTKLQPIAKLDNQLYRPQKSSSWSIFDRMASWWGADIAVDLGSTKTLIYIKGRGIVLNEPSYVARFTESKEVIAIGEEAWKMIGRTPADIEVVQPLRSGAIVDYKLTEYMLRFFMHKVVRKMSLFKPRVIVSTPSGLSAVEKRAVLEATVQAGARKVVLIEEPLAASLGVDLDKAKSAVAIVVDVGGGTTDMAVICQTGIVVSESLRIGSDDFDDAIVYYLKKRKRLLIGKATAENIKKEIGTVDRKTEVRETIVRGRDLVSGLPKEVVITSKDIQKALESKMQIIVEGIKVILEKTPPEMIADIADHGILLTGGGAMINGFDRLLIRSIGINAYLVENPLYSVILGAGRALKDISKLQDLLEELR